ncbi:MAG: spheroidene monooxygenase [Pseudomonadota bacterium]
MSFDADRASESAGVSGQIVTVSFFRFEGLGAKLWAFAQMGLARAPLRDVPELGFFKLMGGGTGEGFTPIPDTGLVTILTTWPDLPTARYQLAEAPVFRRYHAHASESWTVHLRPVQSRGAWSWKMPFRDFAPAGPGPVAALTRATIRPAILLRFWARVPDISRAIGSDPNVLFKQGVGEVPWLHQVTFSIWPNVAAMSEFARAGGPHAKAIKAVREGDWFSEELYARFTVVASEGSWKGADPLAGHPLAVAAE